jgi:hypothetical protein
MNSTTPRSKSTPWRGALIVALCGIVLFTAAHTAIAQQRPKAAQQKTQVAQPQPLTVQLPSPISVTLTRPERDSWDNLSQIVAPIVTLVGLGVAIFTVWWSVRSWKWTYFTKEWSALMQFIQTQPKFMDRTLTTDYKNSFTGDDAIKYEMIARLCIGYLDDIYFLGSKRKLRKWFRGSVKLFAGTHRQWLEDHKDSYYPRFYEFILDELTNR